MKYIYLVAKSKQSQANLCSSFGSFKVPVAMIGNPRLSTMQVFQGEFVLGTKGSERLFKMGNHQWIYVFWCLGRNEAGKMEVSKILREPSEC